MSTNSVPDMQARRLTLAAGASRHLVLRAGAAVVCVEGSARVDEPVTGGEAPGGLPGAVSVRLNAGEAHALAYGGVARITAIGPAELICLDRPGATSRLLRRALAFCGSVMSGNRKNALGALHKISK